FLEDLSAKNIELWVDGDKLRYRAAEEVLTPTLLNEIKEYKAGIIALLQKNSNPAKIHSLLPTSRNVPLPLSFAQQRLWVINQFDPDNAFYNLPSAVRLQGKLHVEFLEQSFSEIINRHEALRTNFIVQEGTPVQIIRPTGSWKLSVVDWRKLSSHEQEISWQQLATKEAQRPFNLATEPLIRGTLVQSDTEHILLLCLHHIVADGWSKSIFIRELATFYSSLYHSQTLPLPELPIQYADYAVWQRQWLEGDILESQLGYWQQQLANAPTLLSLPSDRPRPAIQTFQGGYQSFAFPKELSKALKLLGRQEGATLFMTLLTAFNILLYRYAGQEDILVGSPIANRSQSEIEGLIGFFVNTLVLRTDLSGNPSYRQLLARVKEMTLAAYAHQDIPFELLIDALAPERDLSHTPLFQVMFALHNTPVEKMELAGLTLSPLVIENKTSKFDLTLSIESTTDGLTGCWEYSTDLFDDRTITQMIGHFHILLEGIVANPEQPINQIPLLRANEQHQLLVEWNETQTEYPLDKCTHQLFEEQVERTPNAIAVVFERQQITYRELNNKANQLAHHLQKLGVKPEVLVGICVKRSLEMVVGLLGILKAGGAYVPIDAEYPQERLAFMLENSQVPLLLTQQNLLESLATEKVKVICLDSDWEIFTQSSVENPVQSATPENLAYVIYTSGSTGEPKGTLISHKGLVNYLIWCIQNYKIDQGSGTLVHSSLGFDLTITSLFSPLLVGSQAELLSENQDIESLAETLKKRNNLSLVKITPAHLELLSQQLYSQEVAGRTNAFIIGGENLTTKHIAFWQKFAPDTILINEYGPTETVVGCCIYQVPKKHNDSGSIPIGHAIANTQLYVLDQDLQPVPTGVAGELYIGGAGVARGYLNRPELTAQKFIPNPFSHEQGTRLYKTGDLVRYLSNGEIEYLGRIDYQVKLRGFRIELGEIEEVLEQHSAVRQCVVIVREDVPGNQRLVAYLVADNGNTDELRQYLRQKLPDYMIPNAFVILDSLPLTLNGKVNRRALPAPVTSSRMKEGFVAPYTHTQEILAAIWAEVLGVENVSIHDNLFELGGDSIISIQIVARINQAGFHTTPKQLFQHQTIAELAAVVGTTQLMQAEQGVVTGDVSLTPIQHWFFAQNLPEPHHFNQSVLLEVPPDLKPSLLQQVLQQLLLHHDALRLRFVQDGDRWLQVNAVPEQTEPLSVINLSGIALGEQQAAIETISAELQASLNLSQGPLLQVALFNLGSNQPSRLLVIIHHLAVDGVSWRILLEDLFNGYKQLSQGKSVQLPAKTTSFKRWSEKLQEYADSPNLHKELDYWLTTVQKIIEPLPMDNPLGSNSQKTARTLSVALSVEETQALLQDVPTIYRTQISDVLLTALIHTFKQWTGQSSLFIDMEGHGREDISDDVDVSRTVGWFTSIYPIRLDIGDAINLGQSLQNVKEQIRSIPNHRFGYGVLRYLHSQNDIIHELQAHPQPEVVFNYLGQFDQLLPLPSLKLAKESIGATRSLQGNRHYLLEVDGMVIDGQLQLHLSYSENCHQRATIESLAQKLITNLQRLIAHCLSPEAGGYTKSDFPLAHLNQGQLEQVLAHLSLQAENPKTHWRNIENIYPLSPMQEGMLFHSLYTPQSGAYFLHFLCTLEGNLNVQAFEKAWQQVVARHSVLRTAFLWGINEQSLQVVYHQVPVFMEMNDWRSLPTTKQQEQLQTFLDLERQQNLPLDRAPVMRFTLIQMSDESYQFVWGYHHILLDGWSLSLVMNEVLTLYHGLLTGVEQNLLLQPQQPYGNYIGWLQKQDITAAEVYWREKLQGFTVPTPLTFGKPSLNQEQQPRSNSLHEISLTKQAIANLQSFARQHQLTVNTLVQGAWALLLSRYSGESDVVFGVTVSGRPPAMVGVESIVGLFINSLPIRAQIASDGELLPWLKSLQAQQVESEEYSYSFLVDIQKWSEVPHVMPLFESLVIFENYPVETSLLDNNSDLAISHVGVIEQSNYPLNLLVNIGWEMFLKLSYDPNRFDSATMIQIAQHFQNILEGMVANPQLPLVKIPMLTAAERHQLLFELNQTQHSYPNDKLFHQLFEEQVSRTPDAIAAVFQDQQLTYHQLNARANRWARYLVEQEVGAETLVALLCDRNIDFLTAILAIFKAGGAYTPLNPEHPPERNNQILEQSQAPFVLTTKPYSFLVTNLNQPIKSLLIEDLDSQEYESENLPLRSNTHNLAYVIYTSGSTGKPKGAMLEYRGMLNHLYGKIKDLQICKTDIIAQTSTQTFDISIWQFLVCLLLGGTVEIVPTEIAADPEELISLVQRQKISILEIVPSLLRMIIPHLESAIVPPDLSPLKWLMVTGETLPPQLCRQWLEYYPSIPLINAYGPTECSDDVTHYFIYQPPAETTLTIPVGRPISNTQLYILDNHLQPVPMGVTGELYIGGVGVGRGYLYNQQKTQQAFIENPFAESGKLYKTGDHVRYLPDGNIEFIGRIDYQVKIRGFRIELGEIESILSNHPDVKMAAVIHQTTPEGESYLIAYFVSDQKDNLIPVLRDFLKNKLPDYMIPSAFVALEVIPLTTNGKLNRAALPKLDWEQMRKPYIAPRNECETTVCTLIASLLKLEQVGINDDFFEIGGNSLLITQLVSRLQKTYQLQLPLAEVFSHRTPERLATLIQESSRKSSQPNIKRVSRQKQSVNLTQDGHLIKS
ncbi:MAG: amino acid adenylation domain-containing protein, partial [Rhizonema sp. PD37]|nr:amino acid adenylation domain-containing protein [Rhizonema sp. PD37]